MRQDESLKKLRRLRDAQRLKRGLHLRMNLKENTRPSLLGSIQDGILSKAITECTGQTTCKYPEWMDRRMLAFALWKNQFTKLRRAGMSIEWLYAVTHNKLT
jgi:hypothetical protein